MFVIKDFYHSLLKEHLTDALTFAKAIIKLDDHGKKFIYHSQNSLLFNLEETWMKKGGDPIDVLMCVLVGIFYRICKDNNMVQKNLTYIVTMNCQFLGAVIILKWKG